MNIKNAHAENDKNSTEKQKNSLSYSQEDIETKEHYFSTYCNGDIIKCQRFEICSECRETVDLSLSNYINNKCTKCYSKPFVKQHNERMQKSLFNNLKLSTR